MENQNLAFLPRPTVWEDLTPQQRQQLVALLGRLALKYWKMQEPNRPQITTEMCHEQHDA